MTQTTTALPPLSAAWDPSLVTPDADEFCWTPLQLAARAGDVAEMRRILAESPAAANDSPCGYYGQTALQTACMQGREAGVRLLLDAGADVHFAGGGQQLSEECAADCVRQRRRRHRRDAVGRRSEGE